jgi:hypothetical protein
MTTFPRKNLPRTSLFFSVQILSLGAVDKTYNSMCELKQCIHYPMIQIAMVYVLRKSALHQVTNFSSSTTRVEFCM